MVPFESSEWGLHFYVKNFSQRCPVLLLAYRKGDQKASNRCNFWTHYPNQKRPAAIDLSWRELSNEGLKGRKKFIGRDQPRENTDQVLTFGAADIAWESGSPGLGCAARCGWGGKKRKNLHILGVKNIHTRMHNMYLRKNNLQQARLSGKHVVRTGSACDSIANLYY